MTGKGRNSLSYSDRSRIVICSMLAGLIFAVCLFLGNIYAEKRLLADLTRSDFLYGIKSFFICSAAALFLFTLVEGIAAPKESNIPWYLRTEADNAETEEKKITKKSIIFVAAAYFIISWIVYVPVFLAVYPGIYGYDASSQLMQLYHTFGLPLTTHHPLIHTFYLGACMELGGRLFHSYQAGMAIYSMTQVMAVVCLFDFAITRLYMRGANKYVLGVTSLFLILNPYIVVSSFLTTKDILFGAFFMVFLNEIFALFENHEKTEKEKLTREKLFDRLIMIISGTLMCLFRNQGIYVLILFMLIAIPVLKNKKFAVSMISIVVLWGVFSVAVPKMLHIEGGDPREMLSVPMQQMARMYCNYPEFLNDEQKEYIESIISEEGLKNYVRVNADPVKAEFDSETALSDKGEFISKWAEIGMERPDVYADSFLMMCYGYWYPMHTQYWISVISYDGDYMEQPYNIFDIRRMSRLPKLDMKLRELVREPYFDHVPFLGFILNQAFPFWLTIFAGCYYIYKKRYRMLVPLTLMVGYWGTLLLGPVTVYRYTLAMVYSVPVILCYLTNVFAKR